MKPELQVISKDQAESLYSFGVECENPEYYWHDNGELTHWRQRCPAGVKENWPAYTLPELAKIIGANTKEFVVFETMLLSGWKAGKSLSVVFNPLFVCDFVLKMLYDNILSPDEINKNLKS